MERAERIFRLLIGSLVILLGGCSGNSEHERVERIQFQLQAGSDINPNADSAGNPVRVLIYQLRSTDIFKFSDYVSLVNAPGPEAAEQMNIFYDGMFSPGEKRIVMVPVSEDIQALGIVTAFQDIQQAQWKNVYPVPDAAPKPLFSFLRTENRKERRVSVDIRQLKTTLESLD